MPTSPSLRRSPAKEIAHRRGHSFGSTIAAKSRDDELILFHEMQKNERENFLLEPSDNFESFAKLSNLSGLKLGVNIPRRGENGDFLNVDGDKNDYDWLLTPPETPLFRSLDDEEDQHIGPPARGRAQTKLKSFSRSLTMENTRKSSRSSASPSRLSPSPRSSNNAALARTRSSNSSSRCSPPLALQPTRRSSSPLAAKTHIPPRRSPSPASRRIAGSGVPVLNHIRGASLVNDNRRSSSPKLHRWQSNDPGFSFDAPPNLRTSLPDRPVPRSRGGPPSSFSGLDKGSRGRRQSMSPTSSRRASSSNSYERDRLSSQGKASATSSGDDDLDCVQSVPVGYASRPVVKKSLSVMKTRTVASLNKPSKSFSPSPVPKRSFDSAGWLMDHRKAPQDMFRPLVSSVPTTTFGSGKGSNVHRPMLSHNSSVTTSSNASSEHGAAFGPCMDTDQERHDLAGEWEATASSGIEEDIFVFDKSDEINEGPSCHQCSLSPTQSGTGDSSSTEKYVKSSSQDLDMERSSTAKQTSCDVASEAGHDKMTACTRCKKLFNAMDVDEGDYCEECAFREAVSSADTETYTTGKPHQQTQKITSSEPRIPSESCPTAPGSIDGSSEAALVHILVTNDPLPDSSKRCSTQSTLDTAQEMLLGQHSKNLAENTRLHDHGDSSVGNNNESSSHRCSGSDCQQAESTSVMECDLSTDQNVNHNCGMRQCLSTSYCQGNEFVSDIKINHSHQLGSNAYRSPMVQNAEGAGISAVLLQKSSSNKWPIMEGRTPAATCSEPSYTRDNVNTMRRSIGRDSSSAASSIDLGPSRQSDVRYERLKSSTMGDFDKYQISSTMSHQSIASVSDMSVSSSSVSLCPQSDVNGDTCYPIDSLENDASRPMVSTGEHGSCKDALSSAIECWSAAQAIVNDDGEAVGDVVIQNQSSGTMAHDDDLSINMCSSYTETPSNIPQSSDAAGSCLIRTEEEDTYAISNYSTDSPEHPCEENNLDTIQMQSEAVLASDRANRLGDCCVSTISEEDVLVSATESKIADLPSDEGSRKQNERCFTIEEAADTVLYCSSIVHDLAYRAATIALEQEQESELAGAPGPTVTSAGKSNQMEDSLLNLPHKRIPKHKVKRKRLECETISETAAKVEAITKDPIPVCSASEITRTSDSIKPPKMESKCNCVIM